MDERVLPADRFHTSVRVAAVVIWVGAILLAYWVIRWLGGLLSGGPVGGFGLLVVAALAVVAAQPLAWLAERQLLRLWPSGRRAVLAPRRLEWHDRCQLASGEPRPSPRFDLGTMINFWRWRFEVRRRRGGRVPSGFHCLALRLVQADGALSVYTFASPRQADALAERFAFYELRRPNDPGKLSLGGRDALYLAAENARWEGGAELEPADFEALLEHLAAHVPGFAATPASGG
jgi:hypothetical protein